MKTTPMVLIGGMLLGGIALSSVVPVAAAAPKAKAANSVPADPVETRIRKLHGELHITAAQEPQWAQVAQMMRDNSKTMMDLRRTQQLDDAKEPSAVDELKAYATVIDAHADEVRKFIPVFQSLYDSMPEAQKKTADAVFRRHNAAERSK
jgi:Spy/CpxP family protein refolding chaperone